MSEDGCHRVVILSDCHFGESGALLTRSRTVEELIRELDRVGYVDVLVLLGDIWDLWKTGLREAGREAALFLRALREWGGARRTVLVAGNHDSHVAFQCFEASLWRALGWQEYPGGSDSVAGTGTSPPVPDDGNRFYLKDCVLEVEGLEMDTAYPFLHLQVAGRRVLLMHGHHLDFFSRSFWWAKTSWLSRWVLGRSTGIALSDIDRLNRPFFHLLTETATVPELRELEYRAYRVLRLLARLLRFQTGRGFSPRRYTTIGENAAEARDLLAGTLPGFLPDLFVFGHTHRAGLDRVEVGGKGVLLANTGCWLKEGDGTTPATYLMVDDAIRLRRLSDWEIAVPWEPDPSVGV